jgi:hypothetical protein
MPNLTEKRKKRGEKRGQKREEGEGIYVLPEASERIYEYRTSVRSTIGWAITTHFADFFSCAELFF